MGKKRGNESCSSGKEDETIDATNPSPQTVIVDKVADGDLDTKEAVDAEKAEFPDSSDLEPNEKTPKVGDVPLRRSKRVKTPTTHFGSEKAKNAVPYDNLSETKKKKEAKNKQATIVIDFNIAENKKQEEAKDKQASNVIDNKDDTVDTANAHPEITGEKLASYTDGKLVTEEAVANPAEDEKKEEAKSEKAIVNAEMTKSPNSSDSQPKKKAAKIVEVTRRSTRVKTPTAPFGVEKEKSVVPNDSPADDEKMEEAKGDQAIAANGNEDTPLKAGLGTQSAEKIQPKDINLEKVQPEPINAEKIQPKDINLEKVQPEPINAEKIQSESMDVQQDDTTQAALGDHNAPRSLIEYKGTDWPIEASPISVDYKALYIKSEKRVRELEAQKLQLVKDCEFARGRCDVYENLFLSNYQANAAEAPAISDAKKQKRKN